MCDEIKIKIKINKTKQKNTRESDTITSSLKFIILIVKWRYYVGVKEIDRQIVKEKEKELQ